jgi:lipocalin-like protein
MKVLVAVSTVLALFAAGQASAQVKSLAGTYVLVTANTIDQTGQIKPMYGASPRGLLLMSSDGRYTLTIVAAGLPKFMAGTRHNSTPQEKEAVIDGSIAHFGTYSLAETGRTVTLTVQGSTFPNWEGTRITMPVSVAGDQYKFRLGKSEVGGIADLTFRKAK